MRTIIFLAALIAGDDFDPTAYLRERVTTPPPVPKLRDDKVAQAEMTIKGVPYHVLHSAYGTLYLPRLEHFTIADVERGLCANQLPYQLERCEGDDAQCLTRNRERVLETVTLVRAEAPLTGSLALYAEIVSDTIRTRCGDVRDELYRAVPRIGPEIGLSWKSGSDRQPTTNKVFYNVLRGVGFRSDF